MDERIRDRRRSVSRQRGRQRAGLVFVAVLLLAAVGAFLWLRSSDVFAVKRVTATVTQHVSDEQIAGLASGALGKSLLSLSTGALDEGLLDLPYVRSAEVYRRFPDTLDIRLVEYEPVARLKVQDGGVWLIAGDGRILEKVTPPRGAGLPLIIYRGALAPAAGETAPAMIVEALAVVALVGADGFREDGSAVLHHIVVSAGGTVVVSLKGGPELRLVDPTDLEYKLRVAKGIMEQYLRDGKQIDYIDLTTMPERVAVKAG